ncbi:hypothetical protein A2U01_0048247 [Trifolium medium]|uniref:Uncharacterized protein n=1 Tax=Trifolium medium TaxID=97028 RepID=A0A392QST2_9FABA|nr:hypothetical protein [Trifolium medium]
MHSTCLARKDGNQEYLSNSLTSGKAEAPNLSHQPPKPNGSGLINPSTGPPEHNWAKSSTTPQRAEIDPNDSSKAHCPGLINPSNGPPEHNWAKSSTTPQRAKIDPDNSSKAHRPYTK